MKAKEFKFKMMSIALAMPMLFAACNSEEPNLTPEEEFAIKNSTDVTYSKPIIFETKNVEFFTEYNAVKNIYTTNISYGTVKYKIKEGYAIPDFKIKKIVKEQDGKFENLDIKETKEENYPVYEADRLTISHKEKDTLELYLSNLFEESMGLFPYNYRYYHIYLSDSEDIYGTKIIVNDNNWETMVGGFLPMILDLSKISYPIEYVHDPFSGYYLSGEYSIYLPSDECEVELHAPGLFIIDSITLFDSVTQTTTDLHRFIYDSGSDDPFYNDYSWIDVYNQAPKTILTECGEFVYSNINDSMATKCKIFKNTTGAERTISVAFDFNPVRGKVNFIQAAK